MWDTISSLFTSIISGGMTGILGVAVQRYADFKNKQLDIEQAKLRYSYETSLRELDAKIMAQEWAGRSHVAEIEAAGREAAADAGAFAASFGLEPVRFSAEVKPSRGQSWLLVVLDFVRGLVRPTLTIYLCALTTLVYFQARELIEFGEALSGGEALDLIKQIVGTILYLTTTCVLWWFGTRNKQKPPKNP